MAFVLKKRDGHKFSFKKSKRVSSRRNPPVQSISPLERPADMDIGLLARESSTIKLVQLRGATKILMILPDIQSDSGLFHIVGDLVWSLEGLWYTGEAV